MPWSSLHVPLPPPKEQRIGAGFFPCCLPVFPSLLPLVHAINYLYNACVTEYLSCFMSTRQCFSVTYINPLSKHSFRGLRDCPDELILLRLHVPIRAVFYLCVDIHTHSVLTGAKINIVTLRKEWPRRITGSIWQFLPVMQTRVQLGAGSSYILGCFPFSLTQGRVLFFIRSNSVQCSQTVYRTNLEVFSQAPPWDLFNEEFTPGIYCPLRKCILYSMDISKTSSLKMKPRMTQDWIYCFPSYTEMCEMVTYQAVVHSECL